MPPSEPSYSPPGDPGDPGEAPAVGPALSSADLVGRIAAGDGAAMEQLIAQHLPRLRAFVRLRLGPQLAAKESASDIVQSACRDVLARADQFQHGGEAGFRAWLYKAATRKIADRAEYWGAQRRDPAREAPGGDDALLGAYATLDTPSVQALGREALDNFERVFAQLPEDHHEVIVLSRIVGLSRAQIAEETGRTEAAIRNLLPRALARLADALESGD